MPGRQPAGPIQATATAPSGAFFAVQAEATARRSPRRQPAAPASAIIGRS